MRWRSTSSSSRRRYAPRLNPGVVAAFPENPQCSHSNHARDCRNFQFHVSFPQLGHVSGCEGRGATHLGAATDRERRGGR